jgi:hypothetical protein
MSAITGTTPRLSIQQAFQNGTQTNLDAEHIAMMARTVIQVHSVMLQTIKNQIPT